MSGLGVVLVVAALLLYVVRRIVLRVISDVDPLYPYAVWAGIGIALVGTIWILRIAREDPEAGESPWRYRDF